MARFHVRLDEEATRNVDSIYRWIAERSADGATRWYRSLLRVLDRLGEHADRFPEAPEGHRFDERVRCVMFRMRSGRTYRVLFTIAGEEVHVLFVRAPGQDWASP